MQEVIRIYNKVRATVTRKDVGAGSAKTARPDGLKTTERTFTT